LSKSQRKTGLAGHQNAYFFDSPVHTLQFVGINKKSFAIDYLVINIPLDEGGTILSGSGFVLTTDVPFGLENPFVGSFINPLTDTIILNQVTVVPETASLLMLALGLFAPMRVEAKAIFISPVSESITTPPKAPLPTINATPPSQEFDTESISVWTMSA